MLNMACKAIEDMKKDVAEQAHAEGRVEGREEGRYNALIVSIKNLMTNLSLTAEQAMTALGIPETDFPLYLSVLS
jgi:predicted transposase YdaD